MNTRTLLFNFLLALASLARGADWRVVAAFEATRPGDVARADGATEYDYSTSEIPVSALPAASAARKIIFGNQLVLAWSGANPSAHYKIKATFLSDSADRQLLVSCNGQPLAENLSLPRFQILEPEWTIPAGALGDGDVRLAISRIRGANAVLSHLEVLSDLPQALSVPPPLEAVLAGISVVPPRLSPRPVTVAGVHSPLLSLDGTWRFHPAPPAGFEQFRADQTRSWASIQVPGEWVMQGFAVASNVAAAYWREFDLPADWRGQRIKLRFDTVHSECRVFVNGRAVGAHEGCFTAFELDLTGAVQPGRNTLALSVKNESIADTLASATQYAAHQLGGITRKVQLFALPEINVAAQVATATFDSAFHDAQLQVHLDVACESSRPGKSAARFRLVDAAGKVVVARTLPLPGGASGQWLAGDDAIPVAAPQKWDPEHPYLYSLKTELLLEDKVVESISQRVGFRQIAVRGNQLLVNGVPVKLRGACRHEVDPLRGRSLTPALWQQDADLFRAANVNYIRTSHYPPAEEFLDLCDKYGFFVECEAPLCWVNHGANPVWNAWDYRDKKFFAYLLRANLENLAANRQHPCVTIWSLANESRWSPLFAEVNRRVKATDATRPTSFHDQCWGGYNNARSQADIAVYHYPGENGPARCDAENRPVLFGEYCHVECYNRRELATDPGVRDDWGRSFTRMSDLMYQHDGCLGGAIWAAIDDVFCLPDGKFVGYGMWGSLCDGWRRAKPETWHVKKTYSPVRVTTAPLPWPSRDGALRIPVENRYNFAGLQEVGITWQIGRAQGKVQSNIPARQTGELVITPPANLPASGALHLVFTDPRGFVCDEEEIQLGKPVVALPTASQPAGRLSVATLGNQIHIQGGQVEYAIDRKRGQFLFGKRNGKTILAGGPVLMVLPLQNEACEPVDLGVWKPLNQVCENWQAEEVTAAGTPAGGVEIKVRGASKEAAGSYVITLDATGSIAVQYDFSSALKENPRQWGLVFYAPEKFSTLRWQRSAQWSYYPAGHIGRPVGLAVARTVSGSLPYATRRPVQAWSLDATDLGGNDFSSTKVAIQTASLADHSARLNVLSDGHQSVRAFVADGRAGLLVTGFHTGGGDGFFATHLAAERKPLEPGSRLVDTIRLQLTD